MKKVMFKFLSLSMLAFVLLSSCKKDKEEEPANVINSTSLKIYLSWGGATNPDIDLRLENASGNSLISSTSGSNPYEEINIAGAVGSVNNLATLADGTYTLKVRYYSGSAAANYTLRFEGTNKTYTVTGSAPSTTPDGTTIGTYTIVKSGNKFTIN